MMAGPHGHISRSGGPTQPLAAYQWLVPKDRGLRVLQWKRKAGQSEQETWLWGQT